MKLIIAFIASIAVSFADQPAQQPIKIAVLKFENLSRFRDEVRVESPASYPSAVPLFGTTADGSLVVSPKRPMDRYAEKARALLEQTIGRIGGIQVIERHNADVIEAEYQRNRSLGGRRRSSEMPTRQHGPDFLLLGALVDISCETNSSQSYGVSLKTETTRAEVSIRVVKMSDDRIVFQAEKTGSFSLVTSGFGSESHSDTPGQAIREAIAQFLADPAFRKSFVSEIAESATSVPGDEGFAVRFQSNPRGARLEIDGTTVGQTPVTRKLQAGTRFQIRITKSGFKAWEGQIVPESGLKIIAELDPIPEAPVHSK